MRRRIVRTKDTGNVCVNSYEARKPCVFGNPGEWEKRGRRYTVKGIDNLVRGNTFSFDVDSAVQDDLQAYWEMQKAKKDKYLSGRDR